jgi:hypothetical protein
MQVSHLDETDQWWKRYFGDSFESRQRSCCQLKSKTWRPSSAGPCVIRMEAHSLSIRGACPPMLLLCVQILQLIPARILRSREARRINPVGLVSPFSCGPADVVSRSERNKSLIGETEEWSRNGFKVPSVSPKPPLREIDFREIDISSPRPLSTAFRAETEASPPRW